MPDVMEKRRAFERLSIRAVVFLGFGLILGLWFFAWIQVSLRISEAQSRAAVINARYMNAQETLADIRAQVLIASVRFRDALLDPNATGIETSRRQLERVYDRVDDLLTRYVPVLNSTVEREQFGRLRDEVHRYRTAMFDVLATDRSQWITEARNVLAVRVTPRRDAVIAISEGIQGLNRSGYVQQQAETAEVYRQVQRDSWKLLGLALFIGGGVAVIAIVYAGRLEQQLHRQMAKDLELTGELQDLSAKLLNLQEEERRHIAHELHDEIGQALTAVKVELAYAQRAIDSDSRKADLLRDARAITDGALHQVRDLSYLLHPAVLDELGLVAAVESYVKTFSKRHEVEADLVHEGMAARLSPETEAGAYRIIQEALTNVAKHARATKCGVRLTRTNGAVRIVVEDNGAGFDPESVRSGERRGLGLIGIRERASRLQGTVTIDSTRGGGTRITVELPARRIAEQPVRFASSAAAEAVT
jgi:signal transduction histidine kinase